MTFLRSWALIAAGAIVQPQVVDAACGTLDTSAYVSGASAGEPCVFPFSYHGSPHTACLYDEGTSKYWCATAGWSMQGAAVSWGYCNASCPTTIATTPGGTLSGSSGDSTSQTDNQLSDVSDEAIIALAIGTICLVGVTIAIIITHRSRSQFGGRLDKGFDTSSGKDGEPLYDLATRRRTSEGDSSEIEKQMLSTKISGSTIGEKNRVPADIIDELNKNKGSSEWVCKNDVSATQNNIADYRRVRPGHQQDGSEECDVRIDAQYIAHSLQTQAETNAVRRVNEQLRGEHAGRKPELDADERTIAAYRAAQVQTNTVNRVNEQLRGEHAGRKPELNADERTIAAYRAAQAQTNNVNRVNEQLRGPDVGRQSLVDNKSTNMIHHRMSQKIVSAAKGVTGFYGDVRRDAVADARYHSRILSQQESEAGVKSEVLHTPGETKKKFEALHAEKRGDAVTPQSSSSRLHKPRSSLV